MQRTFVLEVDDENEPLIDIVMATIAPVPEDQPVGSVLTRVFVNDPEETQPHVCQVLPSLLPFSVVTTANGTKELKLTGALDYETNSEFMLRVKCSDGEFDLVKVKRRKHGTINMNFFFPLCIEGDYFCN